MSREITGIDKFIFETNEFKPSHIHDEEESLEIAETNLNDKPIVRMIHTYPEAKEIIEEIKQGNTILLQLDSLAETEEGKVTVRRILDYIGGAMYVMNKKIQKVAALSFLLNA